MPLALEECVVNSSPTLFRFTRLLVLGIAGLAVIGCLPQAPSDIETAYQDSRMKASVTYLHLLRHTPFFTKLDDDQLKWVIKHSREWDAPAGTVIDSRAEGVNPSSDLWILLDGSWQVETKVSSFTAGNNDPGKWYQSSATHSDNRLVTIQRSYVMRIKAGDMKDMLAKGFQFDSHLSEGEDWYSRIDAYSPQSNAHLP